MVVGLLGMVMLAAIGRSRANSAQTVCANNLKQLSLCFMLWSDDGDGRFPMQRPTNSSGSLEWANSKEVFRHFVTLSNEIGDPSILACPADTKRGPTTNFAALRNANVSYWLELNANVKRPVSFLVGDRHLNTNGVLLPNGRNLIST
jgi:hypothetical protein